MHTPMDDYGIKQELSTTNRNPRRLESGLSCKVKLRRRLLRSRRPLQSFAPPVLENLRITWYIASTYTVFISVSYLRWLRRKAGSSHTCTATSHPNRYTTRTRLSPTIWVRMVPLVGNHHFSVSCILGPPPQRAVGVYEKKFSLCSMLG